MSEKQPEVTPPQTEGSESKQQFELQRMYLVDSSFESPQAPKIFSKEQKFASNVEINTSNRKVGEATYEVILNVTLTVKLDDDSIAYLVEIKYSGLFTAKGFDTAGLGHLLGSYCPTMIYPFAREVVCDLIVKGGFPQVLLAPINFDALYNQHVQQQTQAKAEVDDATKH